MFLGTNSSLGAKASDAAGRHNHHTAGHDHNAGGCSCGQGGAPPMMQSFAEMDFERGLWGLITRGANAAEVERFLQTHGGVERWINAVDEAGYTPLLYASRGGDVALCELLLRHGADANAATRSLRQSCLHRAAAQGHAGVVALLLRSGANPTAADAMGATPDAAAHKAGHMSVADTLRAAVRAGTPK